MHTAEFVPPLMAALLYLSCYRFRWIALSPDRRPPRWRVACFASGVVLVAAIQAPPFDTLADTVLVAHAIQHILLGDIASLLIVLGLTGPVLQPLLATRWARSTRRLSHPIVAVALWSLDLYAWHLPFLYQLAIRDDGVHAFEHACLVWFGALLWLSLIGPLPKAAWFTDWARLAYVFAVRLIGAALANVLIWGQTVFYPVYKETDAHRGLNPLSDQNLAGGLMMIEQILLTTALLGWLFYCFASRDEERQELLDLADATGTPLSNERAARAAAAGTSERLRRRILNTGRPDRSGADPPPHEDPIRVPRVDNGAGRPEQSVRSTPNGSR